MLFPSFSDRGKAQAQLWCCSYLELPGLLCVLCSGEYLRSTVTAISTDHNSRRSRDALSALLYNGLYNNQYDQQDYEEQRDEVASERFRQTRPDKVLC